MEEIAANPIFVEVTRGDIVESVHRGRGVVVDFQGNIQKSWGDITIPVFPRSCVKIFQLLPAMFSGAIKAAGFSEHEIALACSSHHGEDMHCTSVSAMLDKIKLSADDLKCGARWPYHENAKLALAGAGKAPSTLHNTCSGKHAAMLAQAKKLGDDLNYIAPTHSVQQGVLGVLERAFDVDLSDAPMGIDGCSVPTWAVPLSNLAFGFARFAEPKALPASWQEAMQIIRHAIAKNPFMVSGHESYVSNMLSLLQGKIYIKDGAEGVMCAALPEYGLGIALKCDDGHERGAEMMLTYILDEIGVFDDVEGERKEALLAFKQKKLYNANLLHVGDIRPKP